MARPKRIEVPAPAAPTGDNRSAHVIVADPAAPPTTDLSGIDAPELEAVDVAMIHDDGSATTITPEPTAAPTLPVENAAPAAPAGEGDGGGDDGGIDDPRFKGKPATEILKAYKNLETRIGEQGQELGRYRQMFDQAVMSRLTQPPAPPAPADNPDADATELNEMLTKPTQYRRRIQQETVEQIEKAQRQAVVNQIKAQATDVLTDPGFATWLRGNVPQPIAIQADSDPHTLMFVLNSYRGVKGGTSTPAPSPATQPAPTTDRTATSTRIVAAAAAPTPTRSSDGGKRTFSRREMLALYVDNPKKYEELSAEYAKALEEGRVRP